MTHNQRKINSHVGSIVNLNCFKSKALILSSVVIFFSKYLPEDRKLFSQN